jgi:hydrogenase maturation factor
MPETSGGMLLSVDREYAEEFSKRLSDEFHVSNWIIGEIDNINEPRHVRVSKDVEYVEITEI